MTLWQLIAQNDNSLTTIYSHPIISFQKKILFHYDYTKMYSLENLFLNVIHVLTSLHPPNLHQIKCVLSSEGFLRKP